MRRLQQFFQRVIEAAPPTTSLEGALKMLLLSQMITMPITLTVNSSEEADQAAPIINIVHIGALFIGFAWGAINQFQARNENAEANELGPLNHG